MYSKVPRKDRVKTEQDQCKEPKLQVSVKSDSLEIRLKKHNPHTNMTLTDMDRVINVAPSAKYKIDEIKHTWLNGSQSWVKLVKEEGQAGQSTTDFATNFRVRFDALNLTDGKRMTATALFSSTARSFKAQESEFAIPAKEDKITFSALVESSPSLEKSTWFVWTNQITQGQSADVEIYAKDGDDLPIRYVHFFVINRLRDNQVRC